MHINIIGGSGFIGTRLFSRLKINDLNAEIKVLDKNSPVYDCSNYVQLNILDKESLIKAVDEN